MIRLKMTPLWCLVLIGCIQFKVNYAADIDNESPLHLTTTECSLTEPIYGHVFNFSALHSELAHVSLGDRGDRFEFNVCGNLSGSCNGRTDVAACLKTADNKEHILGTHHTLEYQKGKMYFTYTNGEKCPSGENYQLHVFLACDYTLDTNQTHVISYSSKACSFYITYETPYACLPEPEAVKSNNCSVRDPKTGHVYDLMPLSDSNHWTSDRQGNAFIINVCKPVLYGANAMCPADSSVCFVKVQETDYKKKFLDYGTVQPQPVIENDQLLVRHTSQTPCNATTNYTSVLNFYCDQTVRNAHPELMGVHDCTYTFSFPTPLACNDLPACTAITHDGQTVDLSSLKSKRFTQQQGTQTYTFGICSPPGQACMEDDGACLVGTGQSTSYGKSNDKLRIDMAGTPYLLYEDGAICSQSGGGTEKLSTRIEFVCAEGNDGGGPKIIENSNCTLLIHYQSELACRDTIKCKSVVYVEHSEDGTGMDMVDLSPLISATDNYVAEIDAAIAPKLPKMTKFFLNVCRPLVQKYGLGCAGDSAACMAVIDQNTGKPEQEKSLGHPRASLVAINRTSAELRYLLGSPCPEDEKTQLSSRIGLHCEMRAGRGTPRLHEISDCHYQFTWATNVICPPHMCNFLEETCEITNDELNVRYNLRTASFASGGKKKVQRDGHDFSLDLCESHHKAVTDYSQGLVNLFFTVKTNCDSYGIINVQMQLICSNITDFSTTFSAGCNLLYVQKTPDICDFLGLSPSNAPLKPEANAPGSTSAPHDAATKPTTSATHLPPLSEDSSKHPAERTGSIGTILASILSVTFFVACLGIFAFSPERRNAVRRFFRRTSSAVRYRRVNDEEESNLLLNTNGEFTESDDDDMLL